MTCDECCLSDFILIKVEVKCGRVNQTRHSSTQTSSKCQQKGLSVKDQLKGSEDVLNSHDFENHRLLSPTEVASILGVSVQTLYGWICECKGPAYHKIGNLVRYRLCDVLKFIDSTRRSTRQSA